MGCTSSKEVNEELQRDENWHDNVTPLTDAIRANHTCDRSILVNDIRKRNPSMQFLRYEGHRGIVEATKLNKGACYALSVLFVLYHASDVAKREQNKRNRVWDSFFVQLQSRRVLLSPPFQKLIKDYHHSQGPGFRISNYVEALENAPHEVLTTDEDLTKLTPEGDALLAELDKFDFIENENHDKLKHKETGELMEYGDYMNEYNRVYEEYRAQPYVPPSAARFAQLRFLDFKHFCNQQEDFFESIGLYFDDNGTYDVTYTTLHIPGHSMSVIVQEKDFLFFDANVGLFRLPRSRENFTSFFQAYFQSKQLWPDYFAANWGEREVNLMGRQPSFVVTRFVHLDKAVMDNRPQGMNPKELRDLLKRLSKDENNCCLYKSPQEQAIANLTPVSIYG